MAVDMMLYSIESIVTQISCQMSKVEVRRINI